MCQKRKHYGNCSKHGLKLIVSLLVVPSLVVSPLLALGMHEVNWGLKSLTANSQTSQEKPSTVSTQSSVPSNQVVEKSSNSQVVTSSKQNETSTEASSLSETEELERTLNAVKAYLNSAQDNVADVQESGERQIKQTVVLKSNYDMLAEKFADSLTAQSALQTITDKQQGKIEELEKSKHAIKNNLEVGGLYNVDDGFSVGGMVGTQFGDTGLSTHVGVFMPLGDATNPAAYSDLSNYTGMATVGITW